MPIIAGRASAAYGAGFGTVTTVPYTGPFGSYDALATTVLSVSTDSVLFQGIPNDYKHLQIRMLARITRSGEAEDFVTVSLNDDAYTNYSWHALHTNGATVYGEGAASSLAPRHGVVTASTATSNFFGGLIIDVLDYASPTKNTTLRVFSTSDRNGGGTTWFGSGGYFNTASVSSIRIKPTLGTNFQALSHFALYGVK